MAAACRAAKLARSKPCRLLARLDRVLLLAFLLELEERPPPPLLPPGEEPLLR